MSFRVYPSYKDSGVEWLGMVPEQWAVAALKRNFDIVGGSTPKSDNPDYWDGNIVWVTPADLSGLSKPSVGTSRRTITRRGLDSCSSTLVPAGSIILSTRAPIGSVALAEIELCINQGCKALVSHSDYDERLLVYLLSIATEQLNIRGKGTTFLELSGDELGSFKLPCPPVAEQTAIADFLDHETAKIDALVEEQRRLIELLKEKRQTVISHAVTKGLNPDAPMKDSGIEWLGEVPEHWEVLPTGYRYEVQLGRMLNAERSVGENMRPYLRVFDVQWGEINTEDLPEMDFPADARERYRLQVGDLMVNEGGSYVGRSAIWRGELSECYYQKSLHRMRVRSDAADTAEFFLFVMDFATKLGVFVAGGNQTTIDHLTAEQLRAYRFAFPPLAEQKEIASFLLAKTVEFDALIAEAERGITLLQEHSTALISAAVTGKINVGPSTEVTPLPIDRAHVRGLVAMEIIERMANSNTFGRVKLQKLAYLAEAHVGVSELGGNYLRMAAGPLDSEMVHEMERVATTIYGVSVHQPGGGGTVVTYRTSGRMGRHCAELSRFLGSDRFKRFNKLIVDLIDISTKGAEAIATLYAVWNDALIEGENPSDDGIVSSFLNDWHPKKPEKFNAAELHIWLGWMRRHGLVPTGTGPKTSTGRLFA